MPEHGHGGEVEDVGGLPPGLVRAICPAQLGRLFLDLGPQQLRVGEKTPREGGRIGAAGRALQVAVERTEGPGRTPAGPGLGMAEAGSQGYLQP